MKKNFYKILLCLALSVILCPNINSKAEVLSNKLSCTSNLTEVPTSSEEQTNINQNEAVEIYCSGNVNLYITQSDIDLMAKLVYAESIGEPFDGQVAVASVVLNRVLNDRFPNSIKEVKFQPNAFSCVKNGDITAYPDQNCYDAVYEALRGKDPTNDALFYYNPTIATCSWMQSTEKYDITSIGHHIFFKR